MRVYRNVVKVQQIHTRPVHRLVPELVDGRARKDDDKGLLDALGDEQANYHVVEAAEAARGDDTQVENGKREFGEDESRDVGQGRDEEQQIELVHLGVRDVVKVEAEAIVRHQDG